MNVLYSLQHLGYTIPPQADAGGISAHGKQRSEWDAGCRFDLETPNTADGVTIPKQPGLTANGSYTDQLCAERRGPGSLCGLRCCRSGLPLFVSLGIIGDRPANGKGKEMKNPKQAVRQGLGRPISCGVTVRTIVLASALAAGAALWALPATALAVSQPQLPFRCFAQVGVDHVVFGPDSFFLPNTVQGPTSFRENAGPTTVTYPLYHGTSQGRDVSYVITDASSLLVAQVLGVNYTPKLAQAAGTAAVQNSTSHVWSGNGIDFPASVDFSPARVLTPSATGFPPAAAQPGAVGEPGYSPLVQVVFLGQTVVLDAPQIANATGQADKIVAIAQKHRTVSYRETDGCYDNESVHYASFDASNPVAATIEDVTYAPDLDAAPSPGCADAAVVAANCSRESLIAFTNGQTGATNPQRQGLNAAILDGPPPLNILQEIPEQTSQFDYSPMWDVHLATWTDAAVAAGLNLRQTDFSAALQQVADGNATGFPAGSTFGPSGFIVNCPVVSLDVNVSG
jgi:hypothetical protein